jgi:hypothetical protein
MQIYANIPGAIGPEGLTGDQGPIGPTGPIGNTGAAGNSGAFITYYDNTEHSINSLAYSSLTNFDVDTLVMDDLGQHSLIKIDLRLNTKLDINHECYYKILINNVEFLIVHETTEAATYHDLSVYVRFNKIYLSSVYAAGVNTFFKAIKNEQLLSASAGGDGTMICRATSEENVCLSTNAFNVKVLGYINSSTGVPSATEYIKLQNVSVKIYRS